MSWWPMSEQLLQHAVVVSLISLVGHAWKQCDLFYCQMAFSDSVAIKKTCQLGILSTTVKDK